MDGIKFPFGAYALINVADSATPLVDIVETKTELNMPITQNMTLSMRASKDLLPGSEVIVNIDNGATARNVSFGSAGSTIKAPNLAGVINNTSRIKLTWTGSRFVADNAWISIP